MTKPLLRGYFHQGAFFTALGAGAMLIAGAHSTNHMWIAAIYSVALASLYACSALYHRPTWDENSRRLLRKIDHSSIFIFFAGTATPICLLGMEQSSGHRLFVLILIGAGLGIAKTLFWIQAPKWVNVILYSTLGFLAFPYIGDLYQGLGARNLLFLLAGGFSYMIGAVFYIFKWPKPPARIFGYHEIFHLFVILASVFHFFIVYDLLL